MSIWKPKPTSITLILCSEKPAANNENKLVALSPRYTAANIMQHKKQKIFQIEMKM